MSLKKIDIFKAKFDCYFTLFPIFVMKWFSILSFPNYLRFRISTCLTREINTFPLPDNQVIGGPAVNDGWRHLNLEVASLAPHGVGVDLAHVPASVHLLDIGDVKLPLLVLSVGQGHSLVPRDDAVVDRHDGLGVHSHPGNL